MGDILIIPDKNRIEESLALAESYKLGFEFNDFWSPSLLDDKESLTELISFYDRPGMPPVKTCHGDFFDITIFSCDPDIRAISKKRIEQSIEVAIELGVKGVVFHSNINPQLKSQLYLDSFCDYNISFWKEMLEKYQNVDIYLENMFDDTPDALLKIAKSLASYKNFGICLDYAHANVFGKTDIDTWVTALTPYIKHLHINDNDLVNDLHLAVGDGKIDWLKFKEYYDKYFMDCTLLIETSQIENQIKSLEYLHSLGII